MKLLNVLLIVSLASPALALEKKEEKVASVAAIGTGSVIAIRNQSARQVSLVDMYDGADKVATGSSNMRFLKDNGETSSKQFSKFYEMREQGYKQYYSSKLRRTKATRSLVGGLLLVAAGVAGIASSQVDLGENTNPSATSVENIDPAGAAN